MSSIKASTASCRFVCSTCQRHLRPSLSQRSFTTGAAQRADNPFASDKSSDAKPGERRKRTLAPLFNSQTTTSTVADILDSTRAVNPTSSFVRPSRSRPLSRADEAAPEIPHRLFIFATKHNTHITLTQAPKSAMDTISSTVNSSAKTASARNKVVDTLLSLSAGNLGFRGAGRGNYDAAFQLGAFAMKQIQEKGMLQNIRQLEVVLRGYGAGREAMTKILLGTEGRLLRDRITSVSDATRLKIGGQRSPKPRRLG